MKFLSILFLIFGYVPGVLTGVADTGSAGLVSKRGYTLDAADNVLDVADGVVGSDGEGLTYDAADRLLTATGAYGALSWTYDGNGNRLTQALGANPADAYAYDGGQLTSVTPGLVYPDYFWNSCSTVCGAALATLSAWAASCSRVCCAVSSALTVAMFASTRLPSESVSMSVTDWL